LHGTTNLVGIEIPSADPVFLTVVGIHVLLGLACTITGIIAMLIARFQHKSREDLKKTS